MAMKIGLKQMRDLALVAKHLTKFDQVLDDVFLWKNEGDAKLELAENAGFLHVEAVDVHDEVASCNAWDVQDHFSEFDAEEVHLAVFDETSDTVFRCVLNRCNRWEAVEMVHAAKTN